MAQYQLDYLPPNNTVWATLPFTTNTTLPVDDVIPGMYQFRIRAMNYMGVWGAWSTVTYTVLGKAAPPSDVTGFNVTAAKGLINFTWDTNTDLDIAQYEIRTGSSWAGGVVLGILSANTFSWQPTVAGNLQFWIKAIDTSGNYSANAAGASLAVNLPAVSNPSQQVIDNNGGLGATSGPQFINREQQTQTIGGAAAGSVGAPFECSTSVYGCQ